MDSGHYTEQSFINDDGTRCVIETNWERVDGPRCQMILEAQRDGGALLTTCQHPRVAPIRLTGPQASTLAYFLRNLGANSHVSGDQAQIRAM